jgi:hypothetical protein
MKRLIFQVSVGKPSKLYETCIQSVADYCKKYSIDHIVLTEPKLKIRPDVKRTGRSKEAVEKLGYLPIYEKENAFEYFNTYDQIAIVDSDIYIKPSAPNIFLELSEEYDFGGVLERDLPLNKKYQSKIRKYSHNAFTNLKDVEWNWNSLGAEFYNMGLMVMNRSFAKFLNSQTPREFITRPEFRDFVDGVGFYKWSTDQMLLNWFVKKQNMKCKNMDWRWNSLYTAVQDEKQKESWFVHFFLRDHLPQQGENIKQVLKNIL